ncbi:MAG TPA: hypothetical protein VFA99_16140 [Acidobacteriaceae bacterium]|nr:hypothetical protein [Acidobacteriaceae bacterium]
MKRLLRSVTILMVTMSVLMPLLDGGAMLPMIWNSPRIPTLST